MPDAGGHDSEATADSPEPEPEDSADEGIAHPAGLWDGKRWSGPIFDGHFHLDRDGRYLDAVDDFVRTGGTGLCLVHKPPFERLHDSIEQVEAAYDDTLAMAAEVREEFHIDVRVILGPHPVVWAHQRDSLGSEAAAELHLASVDAAIRRCRTGTAHGVGEVGRPHYPMPAEVAAEADALFEEVLRRCAATDLPVQLHVEDAGEATTAAIARMADAAGMPRARTVRHYAPADVSTAFTHGLASSVNMGRDSVENLVASLVRQRAASPAKGRNGMPDDDGSAGDGVPGASLAEAALAETSLGMAPLSEVMLGMAPWHMETDHMDDPRRPGAVLGPKTLPKRTHALGRLLQKPGPEGGAGWSPEEVTSLLWQMHHVWPIQLYGIP